MQYLVIRSVIDQDGALLGDPIVIWRGDDPLLYTGGIGTTREGCEWILREFYEEIKGEWQLIMDPRPAFAQVESAVSEFTTKRTDEQDIILEHVFDDEDDN